MGGRSSELDSEKARVRIVGGEGLSIIDENVFPKDVSLDQAELPSV